MNKENNKRYRLLKDLPNASRGVDFIWNEEEKMYRSVGTDIYGRHTYFDENVIQGNLGGWFKEVVIGKISVEMPDVAMQYLISAGIKVIDKTGEYYRLPYWFKFVKGNIFTLYTEEEFNELPSGKDWNEVINNLRVKAQEPQKDYEILNCKLNSSLHPYQANKCLGADTRVSVCEINSIKRLSDNTIWTLGDYTNVGSYKAWRVVSIREVNDSLLFDVDYGAGETKIKKTVRLNNLQTP